MRHSILVGLLAVSGLAAWNDASSAQCDLVINVAHSLPPQGAKDRETLVFVGRVQAVEPIPGGGSIQSEKIGFTRITVEIDSVAWGKPLHPGKQMTLISTCIAYLDKGRVLFEGSMDDRRWCWLVPGDLVLAVAYRPIERTSKASEWPFKDPEPQFVLTFARFLLPSGKGGDLQPSWLRTMRPTSTKEQRQKIRLEGQYDPRWMHREFQSEECSFAQAIAAIRELYSGKSPGNPASIEE